jgi:hypothetical protein
MNKLQFTNRLVQWLNDYLIKHYSAEYNIEVIILDSNISKLANEKIKLIDGYTSFDFHTDIIGLLEHKITKKIETVLLNRTVSAISLREIGEINCFSKVMKPKEAFIASLKGLPEEVNLILLNDKMEDKLLKINNDLSIIVFKWNAQNDMIEDRTVFPINKRQSIL